MFGLGQAAPHLQSVAQARGAAYTLWNIIDAVTKTLLTSVCRKKHFILHFDDKNMNCNTLSYEYHSTKEKKMS